MNSLLHKALQILNEHAAYDGLSAYVYDERTRLLRAGAATRLFRSADDSEIGKGDAFYVVDRDHSSVVSCYRDQKVVVHCLAHGDEPDKFMETMAADFFCGANYPIKIASPAVEGRAHRCYGVLRVLNANRVRPASSPHLTWLDHRLNLFLAEMLAVLMGIHARISTRNQDIERAIHGVRSDVETAYVNLGVAFRQIYGEVSSPKLPAGVVRTLFEDGLSYLEDYTWQIEKVSGVRADSEVERVGTLHVDVLMPIVNMGPSISKAHNSPPIEFNHLVSAGALSLPAVLAVKGALISVLRNIVENAVKYRLPESAPSVRFEFSTTGGFLHIDVADCGIGILPEERELVFVDGFRSDSAIEVSSSGYGLGLGYARESMREMGGELSVLDSRAGAVLRVSIPLA